MSPNGSEPERRACEAFASRAAATVKRKSGPPAPVKGAVDALTVLQLGPAGLLLLPFFIPVGAVAATVDATRENSARRQSAYNAALQTCLEPGRLAETLGPDHPDVAQALRILAGQYTAQGDTASAEPLYARALAIQEKALGSDHPDVAWTLAGYAALRRREHRDGEAVEFETRAEAIRAKAEPSPETHVAPDGAATPPEARESTAPTAPTRPTPLEPGE